MRLLSIPFRNLRYNKSHNLITVTAVGLTILTALCMSTFILGMNQTIENYYHPLKNYDIILEKKGNIIQFLPLNSYFNDSIIENLTGSLNMPFYPTYFKFINGTLQSIIPNALIGFPIAFLADIISGYEISGACPGMESSKFLWARAFKYRPIK